MSDKKLTLVEADRYTGEPNICPIVTVAKILTFSSSAFNSSSISAITDDNTLGINFHNWIDKWWTFFRISMACENLVSNLEFSLLYHLQSPPLRCDWYYHKVFLKNTEPLNATFCQYCFHKLPMKN